MENALGCAILGMDTPRMTVGAQNVGSEEGGQGASDEGGGPGQLSDTDIASSLYRCADGSIESLPRLPGPTTQPAASSCHQRSPPFVLVAFDRLKRALHLISYYYFPATKAKPPSTPTYSTYT